MEELSNAYNPTDLLYGGMEKLSPGGNDHTLNVLRLLPTQQFQIVVDAGCGTGRQTILLAQELNLPVHAVDSHQPFLNELVQRARTAGIERVIQTHCLDIQDIPSVFPHIDLLWSEGSAYNIGFANALTTWASAISKDGFAVVSELSWLHERVPDSVGEFFQVFYPAIESIPQNLAIAQTAGYRVLDTYILPKTAWVEGYYDVLKPRAQALVNHPDASVQNLAIETLTEIDIFNCSEDSYGYVFYVLQRTS